MDGNQTEPVEAILVLIDVVSYTHQARRAGGPGAKEFNEYLKSELTRRATPRGLHWIKPIGDAALLHCDRPIGLLEFVLDLFQREPIPPHAEFHPSFRMIAHKAYFTFDRDTTGAVTDVHGPDAILLFRLEKLARANCVLVTPYLFNGLRHRLEAASIVAFTEPLQEDLKGLEADSPRQIHILRPPVASQARDLVLPSAYREMRAKLLQDVQFIPVFGQLYDPIPMRENFLHLTLDTQRTRGRGNYVHWDYPDLRRRWEVDGGSRGERDAPDWSRINLQRLRADDLFDTAATAVIGGLPGAGKTTILRHFAWRVLEENPRAVVVFVEAKHLHDAHFRPAPGAVARDTLQPFRMLAALFLQKGQRPDAFTPAVSAVIEELAKVLREEVAERRAVVLIDALDEAPSVELREKLAAMANELMAMVPPCGSDDPKVRFPGRCYLSLRAAEMDAHDFTAAPVFLVNSLDTEQIRAIAKKRLGEKTAQYARFDDAIWRRVDVQKIAGTPLTAMLMVFFFEVHDRFARRYDTYRLMVLFVLDRAWWQMKEGKFGSDQGGLNPFFRQIRRPDYLNKHPELASQVAALGYVARHLLYHTAPQGDGPRESERSVSRRQFRELLAASPPLSGQPTSKVEGWVEVWRQENILLPSGVDHWVFLHSTVLEFLAAEAVKDLLNGEEVPSLARVFDEPGRDHLETLPIVCSVDDPIPTRAIGRLGQRPTGFPVEAVLPYRCLVESETVEQELLDSYTVIESREKLVRELDVRTDVAWAYEHLRQWVVAPPGDDEPAKVQFLEARLAELKGLMPLPRDVMGRRVFASWFDNGGSLARMQVKLLQKMLVPEVWQALRPPPQPEAVTAGGAEPYLTLLTQIRGKPFADRVRLALQKCGTSPDVPLTLDLSGHQDDRNLAFHRMAYSPALLGFLGSPNFRMGGTVLCLAVSPDGSLMVSGSNDSTLKLWDVASGKEVRAFIGHVAGVNACAFSPHGTRVVSGSFDSTLKLWDVASGKEVRAFIGHTHGVRACAFSADATWVVSGSDDSTMKLWDVASGKEVRTFIGHTNRVIACAFSPHGAWLVSGSEDNTLKLWDISSAKELQVFTGHKSRVTACTFSPDGSRVLSGSWDSTLKLWDVASGKEVSAISGHGGYVDACVFSPDG